MSHRISPATLIASVALFFSLTGAGMAASGYRITSLFQIAPKVRHALRGERGPSGPAGAAAPAAANRIVGTSLWFAPPGASIAQSQEADMTASRPAGSVVAQCPSGSYALEGGYTGNGEAVTSSVPNTLAGPLPPPGWDVAAVLLPGQSSGWVIAWALCVPNLAPGE